jgi:hypothetical protein
MTIDPAPGSGFGVSSRFNELTKRIIGEAKDASQLLVKRTGFYTSQERKMKFALIGIAAAAAAALATPAPAQAVVKDSGRFVRYYPNANCQSDGPGNSVIDRFYRQDWLYSPYNPFMDPGWHQRHPTHRG